MTFQRSYHYRHKAHPRPRQVKPAEPMDTAISIEQRAEEIFFCGDPHGGFDHIIQAGKEHRPKAMVILGDLQPPAPLHEVLMFGGFLAIMTPTMTTSTTVYGEVSWQGITCMGVWLWSTDSVSQG